MDENVTFTIVPLTDIGRKRIAEGNQDTIKVVYGGSEKRLSPLLIVADGMGGHVGGAIASQEVVAAASEKYVQAAEGMETQAVLNECIQAAYQAVCARAEQEPDMASMGSTAVMAVIKDGKVTVANVGDSRAYLIHGHAMQQISYDHSVVAEQVRAGLITELEARRHPQRNRLTLSISPLRKDIKPYIYETNFEEGDILILCTDGLWGVVPEAILHGVAAELPPKEAAAKLIELANSNGGPDNISVIIAGPAQPAPENKPEDDDTRPRYQ